MVTIVGSVVSLHSMVKLSFIQREQNSVRTDQCKMGLSQVLPSPFPLVCISY